MNRPHAESVTAVKVDGAWTTSIDYHISLEPVGRRVRGHLNGVPVVDSLNALVMLEKEHLPVYYFPRAASLMCFFNEVVDDILVDGVAEPKTRTKSSRD